MNSDTAPTTFEEIVAPLPSAPSCTFRFDTVPCRHRANWFIRKRACCHASGIDFMCDTCHTRMRWLLTLGVEFECMGCGARSDSFATMYPASGEL
ncbi:hypothetical protein [Nocardia altamirensis]|uniref:hypothetical protein n=1 Tax=Nocardia altamirensis TaxID=472158 RepID=UPI0008406AA9|nr:hypothetical protein [Nocardia altamirensis]